MIRIVGRLSKKNRLIISGKETTNDNNQIDSMNEKEQAIAYNDVIE